MKKNFIIAGLLVAGLYSAQTVTPPQDGSVGINTEPIGATLHVTVAAGADVADGQGVAVPNVDKARLNQMTGRIATSAMVYVTDASAADGGKTSKVKEVGYYYFDGTEWVRLGGGASVTAETETFTRNIREDNRTTVVVDQLQDGSTSTKDYYIIMTGNPTAITMPAAASNKGRVLCFYNPGTNNAQLSPTGVGTQGVGVDASQSACYISNGTSWYGAVGW